MRTPIAFALALVLGGCDSASPPVDETADRCAAAVAKLASCYPDLAQEARCSAQTLAEFERLGLEQKDCAAIDGDGKADRFSLAVCAAGQHACGWIFCCDDYVITWFPSQEEDWNVVGVVERFQAAAPATVQRSFQDATREQLLKGVSRSFLQQVAEYPDRPPIEMAVEKTALLIPIAYDTFVSRLRPQDWGVRLAYYLGGQVKVYATDESGRATRQLERMVLSPLPCNLETPLSNNDMTKTEVIQHEAARAKISWRVMFSNNRSTETDVGSVEFKAFDAGSTLVTFHSAHRLALRGVHISNRLILLALSNTFLGHARHYRDLVTR